MVTSEIEKARRYDNVKHMLTGLPPVEVLRNIREADDLARLSFYGAIERYIQGTSDSIFHSAFSVEMALYLRLDKLLTTEEKQKQKKRNSNGMMLSGAISLAEEKGLVKKEIKQKAWVLNNLRNVQAHPANAIAFYKQQFQATLDLQSTMPEIYTLINDLRKGLVIEDNKENKESISTISETASKYIHQRLDNLPELDWCASQSTLKFQKERASEYFKETTKALMKTERFQDLLKNANNNIDYMQSNFAYAGRDELEALSCAFEILKSLKVID